MVNGLPRAMNDSSGRTKAMDALRTLLERLVSPDLTLPEAKVLRYQISQVLGELTPEGERSQFCL